MNPDQARAAELHAQKLAVQMVEEFPFTRHDVPPWLEAIIRQYESAPTCEHLARTPAQPAVLNVYLPAWTCVGCAPASMASVTGTEDYMCDGCRRYLPDEGKYFAVMHWSFAIVPLALCQRCNDRAAGVTQ